ncbi:MAG: TadE family protein [Parafannyhessea sp.]|uniref:TadE family protein n=1 Tax=Parafannyhessea sp. TaxID=2847324 RepID=UPI003EFCF42E
MASDDGQATVEAAVMLPSLMLTLALLVQPACIFFTRTVMRSAAAEGVRVVSTDYDGDLGDCREFVLRRLSAVPDVPLFHVGGREDWSVNLARRGNRASVEIVGHVRPLPLLGVALSAFSEHDGDGLVLRVSVTETVRPSWLRGSYGEWQRIWG